MCFIKILSTQLLIKYIFEIFVYVKMELENTTLFKKFKQIKKPSKVNVFLSLLVLYSIIVTLYNLDNLVNIFLHFLSLVVLSIVGLGIEKIFLKKTLKINTFSISVIIIFLLLHYQPYSLNVFIIHLIAIIGLFLVKIIRVHNKPIMNPVAFSLIFAGIVVYFIPSINFVFISWWGASFAGIVGSIILLPVVLYAGYTFKKFPTLIAFILTLTLFNMINQESLSQVFSLLFFAGVMLIEIKTSPVKTKEQIAYGIVGAVLVLYAPSILNIDNQILALGSINILYLLYKEFGFLKKRIKNN